MKRVVFALLASILAVFAFSGCGSIKSAVSDVVAISAASSSLESTIGPKEFFSTMTDLTVEVSYEPGAEPYTGTNKQGAPYWDLLESNLNGIFAARTLKPHVTVPKTISDMRLLPAQSKTSWSAQDLVDLATQYQTSTSTATTGFFRVFFLKGYFSQDGMNNTSTIGVSVNGTTIVAIFKDVVKAQSSTPNGAVTIYVEQSTVVHELGHALGFVNNGIPLASDHEDPSHHGHCKNPDCVMYWMNEGAADLHTFVHNLMITGSTNMFGQECLDDAIAFHP